ncbi:MAG: PhnD/SsuA/transferrin family substrate-binding protein [Planctomycetota bacterium]|nr:PhnD/SsuA/transferrin family substrate-binding protein [Planctomycetota bacterium]
MFKSLSRVHIATVSSVLAVLAILVAVFAFNEPSSAKKSKPEASISESIPTLTFGVYTSDKPSEMFKKFKPMLRYFEDEIATRIEEAPQIKLVIYKTYELALRAFINDEVDFVRFGPASYVIAKDRNPDVRLLAIEENKGKRRFNGIICVREDSPFGSLADLRGKSFAFGDENSTIGRYLSQAELVEAGVTSNDLEKFDYLGRHDKVVAAVLHGKYDAGAAKESTFAKYKEKGLRELKAFDNVTKPWVARGGIAENQFIALQDVLLKTTNPDILKTFSKSLSGFAPCKDSEYDFVRKGMESSRSFFSNPGAGDADGAP